MRYYFEEFVKAEHYIAEPAYTDNSREKKATIESILIESLITLKKFGVCFDTPRLKVFQEILDVYESKFYSGLSKYDIKLSHSKLKKKGLFGKRFKRIDYAALIDVKVKHGHIRFPVVVSDHNIPGGDNVLTFFLPKMCFSKSMVELFKHEGVYNDVKFEKRYKDLCKKFVEYIDQIESV